MYVNWPIVDSFLFGFAFGAITMGMVSVKIVKRIMGGSIRVPASHRPMARSGIPSASQRAISLSKISPKYRCPDCLDWFHYPYKYCQCDEMRDPTQRDWSKVTILEE